MYYSLFIIGTTYTGTDSPRLYHVFYAFFAVARYINLVQHAPYYIIIALKQIDIKHSGAEATGAAAE
jgi:hypothetical protein